MTTNMMPHDIGRTRARARRRRPFAGISIAIVAALLLAACGGDAGAQDEEAETRTITTVMGDVEVPVDPQRIVAVDYRAAVQDLVELGAPLVGIQTRTDGVWSELGDDAADLPSVWVRGGDIDMEAIIGLEPDLIVGAEEDNADIYDQLTEIAPTVLISSDPTWLEVFEFAGDLTNRSDRAAELVTGIDDRVKDLEQAVADRWPDGVDVTLLRVRDDIRSTQVADRNNRSATWLLNQVDGITVTGDARNVDSDNLSPEQLREADGDVILFFGGGGGSDATQDQDFLLNIIKNPLWDGLSAVKADRAFNVDSDVWFDGTGITAFNLAVDDLMEYVAQAP